MTDPFDVLDAIQRVDRMLKQKALEAMNDKSKMKKFVEFCKQNGVSTNVIEELLKELKIKK